MAGPRRPRGERRLVLLVTLIMVSVALAGIASSCTRNRVAAMARPGVTARLERSFPGLTQRRTLAEDGASPQCFKDRLNFNEVRRFVQDQEAQARGPKMLDVWKQLDLSRLPIPQAQYFTQGSRYLKEKNIDYSGATDLIAVLNRAYGSKGDQEGLGHYAWWLRTGTFLSLSDTIPYHPKDNPEGGGSENDSYSYAEGNEYFTEAELLAFWRLSYLLPPAMRFLPNAKAIYRFPGMRVPVGWKRKEGFKIVIERGDGSVLTITRGPVKVCADSWSNGIMRYTPICALANFGEGPGIDEDFVQTMIHETAHWKDNALARVSMTEAWESLSGWRDLTVTPDQPQLTSHEWGYDPDKEGFISDYAMTNPVEDFAESVAWARVRGETMRETSEGSREFVKATFGPEELKKLAPKKFALITRLAFEGRSYDQEGLRSYYTDQVYAGMAESLPSVNQRCGADAACRDLGLGEAASGVLKRLRAEEPEACDFLERREAEVVATAKSRLGSAVVAVTENPPEIPKKVESVRSLRETLAEQIDAREIYIHCYSQPDVGACYLKTLNEAVDRVIAQYSASPLSDAEKQTERDRVAVQASYYDTAQRVRAFYSKLLSGATTPVVDAARKRWDDCQAAMGSEPVGALPVTRPFSGGTQYVDAGILACVNGGALSDVAFERDRFAQASGVEITDPDVRTYIDSLLLETYLGAFTAFLQRDALRDQLARDERRPRVVGVLKTEILSLADWQVGLASAEEARSRCLKVADQTFDAYFARVALNDRVSTRFIAAADLKLAWLDETCEAVAKDSQIQEAVRATEAARERAARQERERQAKLAAQELTKQRQALASAGSVLVQECKTQNPIRTQRSSEVQRVKQTRRACVRKAWPERSASVWKKLGKPGFVSDSFKKESDAILARSIENAGKD